MWRTHNLQNLQDRKSFPAVSLREIQRKPSSILWKIRPFCGIQRTGGGKGSGEVRTGGGIKVRNTSVRKCTAPMNIVTTLNMLNIQHYSYRYFDAFNAEFVTTWRDQKRKPVVAILVFSIALLKDKELHKSKAASSEPKCQQMVPLRVRGIDENNDQLNQVYFEYFLAIDSRTNDSTILLIDRQTFTLD